MASGSKKVIYAALFGNAGIAVTKFIAAGITRSSAMLAEAIHSVVDTGNQVLLLWGIKRAAKPPDAEFPFGHGKEIYFWSFVVAILIFAVGAGVSIYEGIKHILDPHPIENPTINYIVLAIAMVFEGFAWYFAWRGFNASKGNRSYLQAVHEGKDPTLFVVLFEDSAAMLGLIVAFLGILLGQITGNPYFDGTASIIIGLILAAVAVWLAYESKSLLIGEAASPDVQRRIRELVESHPGIKSVNELITMHMGPENILVNMSVDFADALSSNDVEAAVAEFNRQIRGEFSDVRRIFIEAETLTAHREQERAAKTRPTQVEHADDD
ncbi:MAG: cation diffusion facilitator family transporter [Phycisphaerae bacterium]